MLVLVVQYLYINIFFSEEYRRGFNTGVVLYNLEKLRASKEFAVS
jgi:hypothetical protein